MTGAHHRHTQEGVDLEQLRVAYAQLPHKQVRWRTAPGQDFLTALAKAVDRYGRREVAAALGCSAPGVDYMLHRRRVRSPPLYPTQSDLLDLLHAWAVVEAQAEAGTTVRRHDPAFIPVHRALNRLSQRFDVNLIALAAKIPLRKLKRFTHAPMPPPQAIARAVREALPKEP